MDRGEKNRAFIWTEKKKGKEKRNRERERQRQIIMLNLYRNIQTETEKRAWKEAKSKF